MPSNAKIVKYRPGNAPLDTSRKFPVICCDPPWRYEHIGRKAAPLKTSTRRWRLDEICSLPVSGIAMDDCACCS